MPIYVFRCADCNRLTETLASVSDIPDQIRCEHCQGDDTHRIIGSVAYHASEAMKTARLDPKYEERVDRAMRQSSNADPDRLFKKMKPFDSDKGR